MLRVALLNGCKHNYDHDLTAMIGALIQWSCVVTWLEVTDSTISPGYGFIKATRTNGDSIFVLIHLTENYTLDTSWTTKVRIELAQSHIDDASLINEDQDNVWSIQTGNAFPSHEHVPLASIDNGTITDKRLSLKLQQWVNKNGDETINDTKTFAEFPLLPSSLPSSDYQAIYKKYVDDLVAQAWAINRFEALRTLWEDLNAWDTYFIWRGWAEVDKSSGTLVDMIVWESTWNLTKYAWLSSDPASPIVRRVQWIRINQQWTPSSDLTIFAVLPDESEVELASTATWNLTLWVDFTLPIDQETLLLKFVASSASSSNYYKVIMLLDTVQEEENEQKSHNLETIDSSAWGNFQVFTIDALTEIQEISFEFKSSYWAYAPEMDWRILKNWAVVDGPNNSGMWNTTAWTTLSKTWLNISVSAGDTITLQMMTPYNRSSSYLYYARNMHLLGIGQLLKWVHQRWYEDGVKYFAYGSNQHRNRFDGIEIVWWVEWTQTEWCEWWTTSLTTPIEWAVFLDSTWWLTNAPNEQYIWEAFGTELIIIKQRSGKYEIIPGTTHVIASANTERSTNSGTYIKVKEVQITQAWFSGTARVSRQARSSDSPYDCICELRINEVAIATRQTYSETFVTLSVDTPIQEWDLVSLYYRQEYTSRYAYIKDFIVSYDIQNNEIFHRAWSAVLN